MGSCLRTPSLRPGPASAEWSPCLPTGVGVLPLVQLLFGKGLCISKKEHFLNLSLVQEKRNSEKENQDSTRSTDANPIFHGFQSSMIMSSL